VVEKIKTKSSRTNQRASKKRKNKVKKRTISSR